MSFVFISLHIFYSLYDNLLSITQLHTPTCSYFHIVVTFPPISSLTSVNVLVKKSLNKALPILSVDERHGY